jgi:hypothetical protein
VTFPCAQCGFDHDAEMREARRDALRAERDNERRWHLRKAALILAGNDPERFQAAMDEAARVYCETGRWHCEALDPRRRREETHGKGR